MSVEHSSDKWQHQLTVILCYTWIVAMTDVLKAKGNMKDGKSVWAEECLGVCVCVDERQVPSHWPCVVCMSAFMLTGTSRCFVDDLCVSVCVSLLDHFKVTGVSRGHVIWCSFMSLFLPGGSGVGQSSHTPCVPILVSDLLLHFGVCEGL